MYKTYFITCYFSLCTRFHFNMNFISNKMQKYNFISIIKFLRDYTLKLILLKI